MEGSGDIKIRNAVFLWHLNRKRPPNCNDAPSSDESLTSDSYRDRETPTPQEDPQEPEESIAERVKRRPLERSESIADRLKRRKKEERHRADQQAFIARLVSYDRLMPRKRFVDRSMKEKPEPAKRRRARRRFIIEE